MHSILVPQGPCLDVERGILLLERRCSTEPADTLIAEFRELRPSLAQLLSQISSYLALESLPRRTIADER